ncbi:2-dehydro-3-deoxygalactonokinase [Sphingomonas sp. RB1R13]|uniref:2-dehydro-3-deoxygalactonokinase n=1 Tax=Sphingomonas sp. RB1R13 TaxID=3096159 RepID=UPI002FC9E169
MSREGDGGLIAINWGSSAFRAWLVGPDGIVKDQLVSSSGVVGLDRQAMATVIDEVTARWPAVARIIATGMIGSNIGWTERPYLECPVSLADLAAACAPTKIGPTTVYLAPGLACVRRADGRPDILRGEDMEIFGAIALRGAEASGRTIVLPGTHTKWAHIEDGYLVEFFTSMAGEMFDRLTAGGLLASIVSDEAIPGNAFQKGLAEGSDGLGLTTALFGVRAGVIRGTVDRSDAASYLRGLLIGSEFADAAHLGIGPTDDTIVLVGNPGLCRLYQAAAPFFGFAAEIVDSRDATVAGFVALDLQSMKLC